MYTEITTLEEVYNRHPQKEFLLKAEELVKALPDDIARTMIGPARLAAITYTLNNDDPKEEIFNPDYNNTDQEKWAEWTRGGSADGSGSGFRLVVLVYVWTYAYAFGGARFALKDRPRAAHRWEYFSQYVKDVQLILTK